MDSRLLYISNWQRANALIQFYGFKKNFVREGDYLFLLSRISKDEESAIKHIVGLFEPLLQIVFQDIDRIILKVLPEQNMLRQVQKTTLNNEHIANFFKKVVNYFTPTGKKCWKIGHSDLSFDQSPIVMGILNVTPDSFSDGGRYLDRQRAIEHGLQMAEAGAEIIDIGGESTRPGAEAVDVSQELERVLPVIEGIKANSKVLVSIDTYKSQVAKESIEAGADIINDISGTVFDDNMKEIVEEKKCPVILMHIKGTPKNMQVNPQYDDVHEEVYRFLENRCLELSPLNGGKIILDPGIGFGKSVSDNLKLLRDIKDFTFLDKPILIGTSRKSFIGKILYADIEKRVIGSLTSEIYSFLNGVDILRVHDIGETVEAREIIRRILTA